jgi:hypothetical protein
MAATPMATPAMESIVIQEKKRFSRFDRRYLVATKMAVLMAKETIWKWGNGQREWRVSVGKKKGSFAALRMTGGRSSG